MFKALVLTKQGDRVEASIQDMSDDQLPDGEVLVDVEASTLNYKDGLIIKNKAPLVRDYPHIPGIDFAGIVAKSDHGSFKPGDAVVLNGWGVGERRFGGLAARARVKGDWLVKVPKGWTTRHCMAVGTAGYTSMLAILALEEHGMEPGKGPILVTGGAGGVGSIAIALLAKLGYEVVTSTGRPETHDYLRALGADEIIDRDELAAPTSKPLEATRFQACIDAVGGSTFGRVLRQLVQRGSLAAVGNAGGNSFDGSIIPFLLRGINVLGIDSVYQPLTRRHEAWARLREDLSLDLLEAMIEDASLSDVPDLAVNLLRGQIRGRLVIDVNR